MSSRSLMTMLESKCYHSRCEKSKHSNYSPASLKSFEHSLVQELGYTGYERLRKAFDRAFDQKPPTFAKVVDAGCGTVRILVVVLP